MKTLKSICLFLTLFFLYQNGFCQEFKEGVITYKAYPTKEVNSKRDDVNEVIKKTDEELVKIQFILSFNENESLFESEDALKFGELDNYFRKMALAMVGTSNRIWYHDIKSEKIIKQYYFMGNYFLIESTKKDIAWKITKETKKIGDYMCYRATYTKPNLGSSGVSKKEIEVWFTTELPIKTAPYGLIGLPGLILQINFDRVSIVAFKIDLKLEKELIIEKPKKGEEILEKDFLKIADKKVKELKEERRNN